MKYNSWMIILASFLLIGPFLMGIAINSLGNDEKIRIFFVKFHKTTNKTENITADDFPPQLWSLGFLYPFGGWFGSLIGAVTVDKYGRKPPSIIFSTIAIIGAAMKIFSKYLHIGLLFASRFLDGIATSGMMVSVILLLLELVPPRIENIYKPLIQISVNAGILFIGIISLNDITGESWNLVHISTAAFGTILLLTTIALPESPKFIYNHTKNKQKTETVFMKLRGRCYSQNEVEVLEKSIDDSSGLTQLSVSQFICMKKYRMPIISLIMLHIGQQLCGINAIMAFAPSLLRSAGFHKPDVGGVIITSIALAGSILFAPFVRNQRRKVLWLIGFIFMFISFSSYLVCSYLKTPDQLKLFWLCLFVFMFQIGPGPVVWFISVEMFPAEANGAAQGVASFFNWFANTLVFLLFPIALAAIKINTLYIFLSFQAIIIVYSIFFVVETHDKTPQEVLDEYNKMWIC